jgi:DNA-binding NtrC family response regulator
MSNRTPRILVSDDQPDVLEAVRLLLKGERYGVETFSHPNELIESLRTREADAVLMDLNYTRDTTSGDEGLEAVVRIRAFDAHTPIVVMTAWGSIELAVEAMRRGAQDFVEKPWENTRLLTVLRTQVALGRALRRARVLEDGQRPGPDCGLPLIAESQAMQPVLTAIEQVAPTAANVLITGESGTGKGLIARVLHERSTRSNRSLVVVNIGALAESVFESEMFGHVKGAFTDAASDRIGRFEMADGGTLFLDEIANIPTAQQARLLRVLEDGEFERLGSSRTQHSDLRVIAATNADIEADVEAGRFRRDLLYRLNTIHIHLPPLRERGADRLTLARHFLDRHAKTHRRDIEGFAESAVMAMQRYSWPGNVRELDHVIERAVLMSRSQWIEAADLRLEPGAVAGAGRGPVTLEDAERELISAALRRHDGNVLAAAKELDLTRSSMYRRMEKHGL